MKRKKRKEALNLAEKREQKIKQNNKTKMKLKYSLKLIN